jgi:hypothetical protein
VKTSSSLLPKIRVAFRILAVVVILVDGSTLALAQESFTDAPFSGQSSATSNRNTPSGLLQGASSDQTALVLQPFPAAVAMAAADGGQPFDVVPAVVVHQQPFSRIGIGVDVATLGVGVDASIVLTEYFDARLSGNYFAFNNGRIEADGVNVYAGLHLASAAASLDFYPFNTPIRLSAGLLFYNTSHASGNLRVAPGTGFTMNGEKFYAGSAGTTPLTGVASIAFHSIQPAPTLTFGFGKFIPRSGRHWSFPSEYGVAFTGAPAIKVNMQGTVCSDPALTMCSEVSDTSNPVGAQFNTALQAKLAVWRRDLGRVQIFPILSGGVTYSFNTPWQGAPKARF